MHLVVQLHLDCEHHADTLEPALGNEAATAVDARDLPKSLHDGSTLVGTVRLNFRTHLILTNLCPARTEAICTRPKTTWFSRLAMSLSNASFKRAA